MRRDDKENRPFDPDETVAEDDFWASILKETMEEAESRRGKTEPPMDDWDAILDEAMAEAETRMGESGQTAPEDGATASEEIETAPDDGATDREELSPHAVSVVTGPLSFRRGETLLDTYRVESDMIGKGGMGAVWKVRHEGWNTDLAMKRPKPSAFQTEKQKQDFISECECWINLGLHPNIVSCYYVREIDGTPTIFSEWMAGGDLETHINKGTLYEGADAEVRERLLDVAIQFARGLRYAHENNLVHRDVKPDNLLLTKNWEAKVSDFGISQAREALSSTEAGQSDSDPNATQAAPGGRAKTPSYCSPEQAEDRPLTRRTDIYSWAVSVLEMYLGYKPWAHGGQITGPVAGLLCRDYFEMCEERPIPEALRELLAKCLEQKPDDRPHDFGEVEAALAQIYKTETGADYPRPQPKSAADTADSLNNRALSFLDLGKTEEAAKLWERALAKNPMHVDSLCNRELLLLSSGQKFDYEVVEELEHYPAIRKADLAKELVAQACPWVGTLSQAAPRQKDVREIFEIRVSGDEVCFTARSIFYRQTQGVGCFHGDDPETPAKLNWLTFDRKRELRHMALCPDGRTAVLIYVDCSLCLWDWREKRVLRQTEPLPELLQLRCRDYGQAHSFSPDGRLLAVNITTGSTSVVLRVPELEVVALPKMVFLGFRPDGRGLLRGKVSQKKEALYLMDADGGIQEAFRFEKALIWAQMREYCGPKGCFLGYMYDAKDRECFYLNENFEKIPARREFFDRVGTRIQFYDAAEGLLCSGEQSRICLWDLPRQHCLSTVRIPNDRAVLHGPAVYDGERRRLLLWNKDFAAAWLTLPAYPILRGHTHWRLSRVTTVDERLDEESRITLCLREFESCRERGDVRGMARIHRDCLKIPGFGGSPAADRMEDALEPLARKHALRAVRAEDADGFPEMLAGKELTRCTPEITASYTPDDPGKGVRLYRPDGTLLRRIELPDTAAWVAVRGEKIIAFGNMLDAVSYDLYGRPLDPARSAPERCEPPKLNNDKKYGYPVLLAVDGEGRRILYGALTPFDPFRRKWRGGVFQRDLQTGRVLVLAERTEEDYKAYYLKDGSILLPPLHPEEGSREKPEFSLRQLDPEDGSLVRRLPLTTQPFGKIDICRVQQNRDRDIFAVNSQSGFHSFLNLYSMEGELLGLWLGNYRETVALNRCCIGLRREEFCIQDVRTEQELFHTDRNEGEVHVSMDAREIWRGSLHLRLEYEYEAD